VVLGCFWNTEFNGLFVFVDEVTAMQARELANPLSIVVRLFNN